MSWPKLRCDDVSEKADSAGMAVGYHPPQPRPARGQRVSSDATATERIFLRHKLQDIREEYWQEVASASRWNDLVLPLFRSILFAELTILCRYVHLKTTPTTFKKSRARGPIDASLLPNRNIGKPCWSCPPGTRILTYPEPKGSCLWPRCP